MLLLVAIAAACLAVSPFLLLRSSISDYFIAAAPGVFTNNHARFACVNSVCHFLRKKVSFEQGDYVEIRAVRSPSLSSDQAFWLAIFVVLAIALYGYFLKASSEQLETYKDSLSAAEVN